MINILTTTVTESEIADALNGIRPVLPPYGADEWRRATRKPNVTRLLEPLRAKAEAEIGAPLPVLTDALYADYHQTGNRLRFETLYFERRRMLGRAAMCALLSGDSTETWIPSVIEKLTAIFDEESWSLPAHTYVESGKNPDMIDLFAGETANTMAEILVVFGALLPDELTGRIKTRLHKHVFENYCENYDQFFWTTTSSNWNAVCHQGVLGTALAVEEDRRLVAKMLVMALPALRLYLSGFGADGACSEGPAYWQYGFGWFTLLNEQLEKGSSGGLSLFEGDQHIREIALYAPRISLAGGQAVSFADASPTHRFSPRLLGALGNRLGLESLNALAAQEWPRLLQSGIEINGLRCDFFYLTRLLLDVPELVADETQTIQPDHYFSDLEILVAHRTDSRGNLWELAVKGGNNAEHHNHNDCGSYVLNINGTPIAFEIGAPEYTRAFFGPNRYDHLAARTKGHSLPIVNGFEQIAGAEFTAHVLRHVLSEAEVSVEVDLTACYPVEAGLERLVRTAVLDSFCGTVEIEDKFVLRKAKSFETAVITEQTADQEGESAIISHGDYHVRVTPLDGAQIAAINECAYSDHKGQASSVRRIVFAPQSVTERGSVRYRFELA